ncbi:MAG: ion channel [Pseudorhodobacter sp.]|nr:ion channel [Pseudorhodobacter sp.]
MILQIMIGTGVIFLSVLFGGVGVLLMEIGFLRSHKWLMREPHGPKLLVFMCAMAVMILSIITLGVWTWAMTFWLLGLFATLEEAVYFALVSYTTLGFGDVLLEREWRLLSGMAAANGLLNFGLLTAVMVEALRQIRLGQAETRRKHRP